MRWIAIAGVCALGGCGGHTEREVATVPAGAPAPQAAGEPLLEPEVVQVASVGVPHGAQIDLVAAAPDGSAVVTRDALGGVRLWPAVDGGEEPRALPLPAAVALSVARREDGCVVAGVTGDGAARIVLARGDGVVELGATAPGAEVRELHVVRGGAYVVALGRDHAVRLLAVDGRELARVERRGYRPERLVVAGDGRTVVAARSREGGAELRRFAIADGALRELGARDVAMSRPLEATPLAADDAGARVVWTEPAASGWVVRVVEVDGEGEMDIAIALPAAAHTQPRAWFVDGGAVFVNAAETATAWMVDLPVILSGAEQRGAKSKDGDGRGAVRAVPGLAGGNGFAVGAAGGVAASGFGNWLYVAELATGQRRYLGYEPLQVQLAAVSPTGARVAWIGNNQLFVEHRDEGTLWMLPARWLTTHGASHVMFHGEHRLVVIDHMGGVRVLRADTGAVVAETGVSGGVREAEVRAGWLRATRHYGDTWVMQLADDAIAQPRIVADGSVRAGLLDPSAADGALLWTLDGSGDLRHYTVAALEAGDPVEPAARMTNLVAVDGRGRRYQLVQEDGASAIAVQDGGTIAVARADFALALPSPDGSGLAVSFHGGGAVQVFDTATGAPRWSFAAGATITALTWSADSGTLAVASQHGAVTLDAATGAPVVRRCAQPFTVRGSPPAQFAPMTTASSLCESSEPDRGL